jgi:AraC-like DNA-binding protein
LVSPLKLYANQNNMIDLGEMGLPEIPMLGQHRLTTAHKGLGEHVHEGIVEICYLASGMRTYHVDGKDFPFKGGELFVTFPGERHGSGGHVHGKGALFWIHVCCSPVPKSFLGLKAKDHVPLLRSLENLPRRWFSGDQRFQTLMERLFQLHRDREKDPLARLEAISSLIELLTLVVRWSSVSKDSTLSSLMEESVAYIRSNVRENVSIEGLAERGGLSLSRYKARFRDEVGVPPREFILRGKVTAAEELLRGSNLPITTIAHQLGFSSSQYFATVFKRFTNSSPSSLRTVREG